MGDNSKSSVGFSRLGLGTWQFGGSQGGYWGVEFTQELANSIVQEAAQNGIKYFDTAEDYGNGNSERQLGIALNSLPATAEFMVGSKILPNHCAQSEVRKYVQDSLARLKLDRIDLLMIHWPISKEGMAHFAGNHTTGTGERDYSISDGDAVTNIPCTETALKELAALQSEGKIKHIGVSNFGRSQLEQALATGIKIAVNQLCYNFVFRPIEYEILPFCKENGIEVIAYSPLMQGICLGKWNKAEDVPIYRARTRHFNSNSAGSKARHGEEGHEELLFETIEKVKGIAKRYGYSMLELAIAFPLHKDGISCVIVGATKVSHVKSSVDASTKTLSTQAMLEIDQATEKLKAAMGKNCDLWQGGEDSRIR